MQDKSDLRQPTMYQELCYPEAVNTAPSLHGEHTSVEEEKEHLLLHFSVQAGCYSQVRKVLSYVQKAVCNYHSQSDCPLIKAETNNLSQFLIIIMFSPPDVLNKETKDKIEKLRQEFRFSPPVWVPEVELVFLFSAPNSSAYFDGVV